MHLPSDHLSSSSGGSSSSDGPPPPPPGRVDPIAPLDAVALQPFGGGDVIFDKGDRKPWRAPNEPLFRFGAARDLVTQMVNVKDRVLFKVFKNLIEIIIMKNVDENDIAMALWLLTHVSGHLFVNLPSQDNPKKLVHIANITKQSRISDLVHTVVGQLVKFPTHLVLQAQFSTEGSIFTNKAVTNREALDKIYERVRIDYQQRRI